MTGGVGCFTNHFYLKVVKIYNFKSLFSIKNVGVVMKTRKAVIGGLLVLGLAGIAKLSYDGINEGWFYRLCDKAYAVAYHSVPEKTQAFIRKHPVYTAGLEGLAAGLITGAVAGAACMTYSKRKTRSLERD